MTVISDIALLNPIFAGRVRRLHAYLIDAHETGRTKTRFEIFETYRHPTRQAELLRKRVSKAGPWQSPHQFGLAVDFVPHITPEEAVRLATVSGERVYPGWNWHSTHDYSFLAASAERFAVAVPISWDKCHCEHPDWPKVRALWRSSFE